MAKAPKNETPEERKARLEAAREEREAKKAAEQAAAEAQAADEAASTDEDASAGEADAMPPFSGDTAPSSGAVPQDGQTTPDAEAGAAPGAAESVTAPPAAPNETPQPIHGIKIVGPKGGRWRAGRYFTPKAVFIPLTELSEDEARRILDDPKLIAVPETR